MAYAVGDFSYSQKNYPQSIGGQVIIAMHEFRHSQCNHDVHNTQDIITTHAIV